MPARSLLPLVVASIALAPASADAQRRLERSPSTQDSTWNPDVYNLGGTTAGSYSPSGVPTTTPPVVSCVPTRTKVSEGECKDSSKKVTYSDGCGGQSQEAESCKYAATWSLVYRGLAGGDGWMNLGSIYTLLCLSSPDDVRQPDSSCGPKPLDFAFCQIGVSNVSKLPFCPDGYPRRFSTNFVGLFGSRVVPYCANGC